MKFPASDLFDMTLIEPHTSGSSGSFMVSVRGWLYSPGSGFWAVVGPDPRQCFMSGNYDTRFIKNHRKNI
jgi:hypothetical protein